MSSHETRPLRPMGSRAPPRENMFVKLFDRDSEMHRRRRYTLRWDWHLRNIIMGLLPTLAALVFVSIARWHYEKESAEAVRQRGEAIKVSRGELTRERGNRHRERARADLVVEADDQDANVATNRSNATKPPTPTTPATTQPTPNPLMDSVHDLTRRVEQLERTQAMVESQPLDSITPTRSCTTAATFVTHSPMPVPHQSVFASRAFQSVRRLLRKQEEA
mmetsp:Transcript_6787/g.13857  ORF Transcript_6787/g.13857 Transcript_6787/m.13857 type:complete len:220 (-) Transcript_6787:192-851(-)